MIRTRLYHAAALGALACAAGTVSALAADPGARVFSVPTGTVIVPGSSAARPEDAGVRMHTNIELFLPKGHEILGATAPSGKYETPASLACLYGETTYVKGCNPETLTTVATGGSKMVAIVDAFDYPTAANDLSAFSAQFGLPPITNSNFQVVYGAGKKPKQDSTGGWELEEALDIEMAHALAPNATVVLVEAKSNSGKDLLQAEAVAANLVAAAGGGEVSNSWSGGEYKGENGSEKDFAVNGVVYFASAGDSAGVGWPSVLKNVVGVGGTAVNRSNNGDFIDQSAWSQTGGGSSQYVKRPGYQHSIKTIVGSLRGIPDISLVADPSTGVWIYDTTPYNNRVLDWLTVGGTSVSSPASAALVNNAGHFFATTNMELEQVYAAKPKSKAFTDITKGSCGANGKTTGAVKGWDFCTGVGTPLGTANK